MTPAIDLLKKHKISFKVHEYAHDPANSNFGNEVTVLLDLDGQRVFKTLLTCPEGDKKGLLVAVVPVSGQLDLKKMAKAAKAKKLVMADPADAQRATGYLVGGISPLGQKRQLALFVDSSAASFDSIYVSGGKRGLSLELNANDLVKLARGQLVDIAK